jgi:hypothetical protein
VRLSTTRPPPLLIVTFCISLVGGFLCQGSPSHCAAICVAIAIATAAVITAAARISAVGAFWRCLSRGSVGVVGVGVVGVGVGTLWCGCFGKLAVDA